jgi:hypothetical protein
VYFRLGKLQKANDFLREAALKTNDPIIWEHLGAVEEAQGNAIEAVLSWDESMLLKPEKNPSITKINQVFKKLSSMEKLNLFIKRASRQFSDIQSLDSLMSIKVCESKPCFQSKAQIGYFKGQNLMIEIPGPLTGPVMRLIKPFGKPAQYGALHPLFQAVEYYATRGAERVESLLSGQVFNELDLRELKDKIVFKSGLYTLSDGRVTVKFSSKDGRVKEISWKDEDLTESLHVGPYELYSKHSYQRFPRYLEWEDKKENVSILLDFQNPALSLLQDPE